MTPAAPPSRETPREVTLGLEQLLSNSKTGIIGEFGAYGPGSEPYADSAGVTSVSARLSFSTAVVGSSAFDPLDARARAIGEAAERYALVTAKRWLSTRLACHEGDAAPPMVDLRTFALPSENELPALAGFHPYSVEDQLGWAAGHVLAPDGSEAPVLLPAQATLAHHETAVPEKRHAWASSSGAGAGNTKWEAVRSGLREILERDAFAVAWLSRPPLAHVEPASVEDALVSRWFTHHASRGREPSLVLLPGIGGFPVFAAQVVDRRGPLFYAAGFGASLSPLRAARRAVEEAEQGRYLLKYLLANGRKPPGDPSEVRALDDQLLYWQDAGRLSGLDPLTRPDGSVSLTDLPDGASGAPAEDVRRILDLLAGAGLRAYYVDVTPPEFRERIPVKVVATAIPGSQPVRMSPKPWCLANRRLKKIDPTSVREPPPFA